MPFCPKCKYEYEPHKKTCPDCDEKLTNELKPEHHNPEDISNGVEIYKVPDEMTGRYLFSFLKEAGLNAQLINMQSSFYGGALELIQGYWGKIIVPKYQASKARKLLEEFLKFKDQQ